MNITKFKLINTFTLHVASCSKPNNYKKAVGRTVNPRVVSFNCKSRKVHCCDTGGMQCPQTIILAHHSYILHHSTDKKTKFVEALCRICGTPCNTPEKPTLCFKYTISAAEKNKTILQQNSYNVKNLINSQKDTTVAYGS